MGLPGKRNSEHSMLDGIKSKLGFGDAGTRSRGDYADDYDDYADDYGDDYGEYGDYGDYADDYDDGEPGSKYDPYAPVTTRGARSSAGRSSSTISNLVSIDDVRAHSSAPASTNSGSESYASRRVTTAHTPYRGERAMVDSSLPPTMTPEGTAAMAAAASHPTKSEGLNSLFEPSTGKSASSGKHAAPSASTAPAKAVSDATSTVGAFTRQPSASSAAASIAAKQAETAPSASAAQPRYSTKRSITVLKPVSYGDAERIVSALKAGDAVVLGLLNTPETLTKRILDFSFGASCALDASVECVADKVFAITKGAPLSEVERMTLRNQGVF